MTIVDSDILIWLLRGKVEVKDQFIKLNNESNGIVYITPIQIAEIYCGIRENELNSTMIFLESFEVINIDSKIGQLAGNYMKQYQKSHELMMADALIAATCNVLGFSLWTLNKKHYPMINKKDFYV